MAVLSHTHALIETSVEEMPPPSMQVSPTNLFVQNRGQGHGDFAKIMLHFINSQKFTSANVPA